MGMTQKTFSPIRKTVANSIGGLGGPGLRTELLILNSSPYLKCIQNRDYDQLGQHL